MENLIDQIHKVARLRREAIEFRGKRDASLEAWKEANQGIIYALAQAEGEASEEEVKLRELTLQVYADTGNKAPALGVGIREVTKLDYDRTVAFDWAVEHRMALKLDISGFEKIVKASPLDFVRIYQEPQATINLLKSVAEEAK